MHINARREIDGAVTLAITMEQPADHKILMDLLETMRTKEDFKRIKELGGNALVDSMADLTAKMILIDLNEPNGRATPQTVAKIQLAMTERRRHEMNDLEYVALRSMYSDMIKTGQPPVNDPFVEQPRLNPEMRAMGFVSSVTHQFQARIDAMKAQADQLGGRLPDHIREDIDTLFNALTRLNQFARALEDKNKLQ